jgi:hypothetical protein
LRHKVSGAAMTECKIIQQIVQIVVLHAKGAATEKHELQYHKCETGGTNNIAQSTMRTEGGVPSMVRTLDSSESHNKENEKSESRVRRKGNVSQDIPTRKDVVMELLR